MSEYKPTNQLRFVRRAEPQANDEGYVVRHVLQQLWESNIYEVEYGEKQEPKRISEWRDVELVIESEAGE